MIILDSASLKLVQAILKKYVPQHEVRAFGSRVDSKPKPFSDLDLVVMTTEPLPAETRSLLKDDFSESDLVIKVDLLDWADTSDSFRELIKKKSEIIFKPGFEGANQVDIKTLKLELRRGFTDLYGVRLKGLYIFGSYARGEAKPDSDLDVLVVLDSYQSFAKEIDFSSQLVSDLSLKYDVSISRVTIKEADWQKNQNRFVQTVRREAVAA